MKTWLMMTGLGILAVATAGAADADAPFRKAVALFFEGRMTESVAAFDDALQAEPALLPQLWQRGLALYYAEDYAEGRRQFEEHQKANPHDVENAVWHFICVAREDSVTAARQALIPITGDTRVPMKEVHDLFAGRGTEEQVIAAALAGEATPEVRRNHLCYAHLYLGLYHEAHGNPEQARAHMLKAAQDHAMNHYMGCVAQVHVKLRGWAE